MSVVAVREVSKNSTGGSLLSLVTSHDENVNEKNIKSSTRTVTSSASHFKNTTRSQKHVTSDDPAQDTESPVKKRFFAFNIKALKYREGWDTVLISIGILGSMTSGALPPLNMLIMGNTIAAVGNPDGGTAMLNRMVINFLILAGIGFCVSGISVFCLELSSERQVRQLKLHFLKSIMAQEMGHWDSHDTGVLAADIEQACVMLRDGTGMKLGLVFQFCTQFFVGYAVALFRGWRMALVMLVVIPLLAIGSALIISRVRTAARRAKQSFEQAGAVAEEALPAIRSIAAFGLEDVFAQRFELEVNRGLKHDLKASRAKALSVAFMFAILFLSYALGWWYGGREVRRAWMEAGAPDYTVGGRVVTVFFAIIVASFSLGQIIPNANSFVTASQAVESAQALISRRSQINPYDKSGRVADQLKGKIEFRNVKFAYPTRQDEPVYENISFTVEAGQTVALVGPSGCGKSTIVQLLQRFYDPQNGQILVDGEDITNFQLHSYREQMALVSQEPRLFCDTIKQNIAYGRRDLATMEEIRAAARLANAHDFIQSFPKGYSTNVGQGGSMLSGGQKQRVAIARAILRDPSILLLDEATSALDNQSETVVQRALDHLISVRKRTTIIIAHRLSTIRYADQIIVIDNPDRLGSRVIEQGTHDELMRKSDGLYKGLVEAQSLIVAAVEDDNKETDLLNGTQARTSNIAVPIQRELSLARNLSKFSRLSLSKDESKMSCTTSKAESLFKKKDAKHVVWIDNTGKIKTRLRDVLRHLREDWWVICIGIFCSVFVGCIFPTIGIVVSEFIGHFYTYDSGLTLEENSDNLYSRTCKLALLFVGLSALVFLVQLGQEYSFGYAGERLIARLRRLLFKHILKQDMEFFDAPQNTMGTLLAIISADCALMKGVTGGNMSIIFQNSATLVMAVVTAFITSPRLAAVALVGYVLNFPVGFIQNRLVQTTQVRPNSQEDTESAGFVLSEAVQGLKVITSYNLQEDMYRLYNKVLDRELKAGQNNSIVAGIAAGFANSLTYACNALSFWYGGTLLQKSFESSDNSLTMKDIMRVVFVLMMASNAIGRSVSWVTDRKKAKMATSNILGVLQRKPRIQAEDSGLITEIEGHIAFEHVKFRYTHRPEVPVLADIDMSVQKGQTIALVGGSGSGKSTIVQLLERFYDVEASDFFRVWIANQAAGDKGIRIDTDDLFGGAIKIDGIPIQAFNLKHLRAQIGLVSQEPVLFQGSVAQNIGFGCPTASKEDIIRAAKLANAHKFITNLTDGYETEVGHGGSHLSGGQKQRIAIARALVRDPRLLILDEATSALDPESEELVQQALDDLLVKNQRTTIIIAHRLSTVRQADKIIVFAPEPGVGSRIAEVGTHDELMMKKDGIYRALVLISQKHDQK